MNTCLGRSPYSARIYAISGAAVVVNLVAVGFAIVNHRPRALVFAIAITLVAAGTIVAQRSHDRRRV